jgi:DmsE family decaheme c-type cytochrome
MKQTFAPKLLFAIALTLLAISADAQKQQPAVTTPGVAPNGKPQSAVTTAPGFTPNNARTCLTCHGSNPKVMAIFQSPMANKGDARTQFAIAGCEACHGNAADHVAGKAPYPAIVFHGPHASPLAVRNQACLACHESHGRLNWVGSKHDREGVACTDCHTAHAAKDPVLVRATEPNTCFTCHARIRSQTFEYSHHPIREGLVSCSDCHNPHGSFSSDTKMLKEFTINQTCYNCHADKRGPLLWEHQPVRENCMNCHKPHGSNQPRLQIEQINFLCSSCHSATGANHSGGAFGGLSAIPFRGPGSTFTNSALANQRACTNCHSQVHGSNSPAGAYFFR